MVQTFVADLPRRPRRDDDLFDIPFSRMRKIGPYDASRSRYRGAVSQGKASNPVGEPVGDGARWMRSQGWRHAVRRRGGCGRDALWPCRMGVQDKLTRDKRDWQAHYDAFKEFIVGGADGQLKRTASKFGLVAMPGELAIE